MLLCLWWKRLQLVLDYTLWCWKRHKPADVCTSEASASANRGFCVIPTFKLNGSNCEPSGVGYPCWCRSFYQYTLECLKTSLHWCWFVSHLSCSFWLNVSNFGLSGVGKSSCCWSLFSGTSWNWLLLLLLLLLAECCWMHLQIKMLYFNVS